MDDETLIQLGLDAEVILNDETFKRLFEVAERRIAQQFLAIPFEQRNAVEALHLAKCGMDFFNRQLTQFVDAKNQIVERMDAEHEQKDADDFI